jgi:hypothetical protein
MTAPNGLLKKRLADPEGSTRLDFSTAARVKK